MRSFGIALLCAGIIMCNPRAWAIDCTNIKPVPAQDSQTSLGAATDGRIDSLFKKLLADEATGRFEYQKAITDILPQFPDADRLYAWDRILFMQCMMLNENRAIDTRSKLMSFNDLLKLYNEPPPGVISAAVATSSMTNSGNNINAVQGSGNAMSIGGKP